MKDYYAIPSEEFGGHSCIDFRFVETHADLCRLVSRELADLIMAKAAKGEMTKVILPVGPIDYRPFAELCNRDGISCDSLVIFAMDRYCYSDGTAIPADHPLSFRAFFQRNLIDLLDEDKKLPEDQLILPDPLDLDLTRRKLEKYGPIDVTYGGLGINGHFAFNSPPSSEVSLEAFASTTTRLVDLRESDVTQVAMGGTGGNIEVIPTRACTLGMKELLSAKRIHLTFMRPWHAGVLRRALFGPVTPSFPGSLLQRHPIVTATITAVAAALPLMSLLQQPRKSP